MLFYRASDDSAATGRVHPTTGAFTGLQDFSVMPRAGFSHVTYAGAGRLLFYRASDGITSPLI